MTKTSLSYSKIVPSVQQFGFPHGSNSAAQAALRTQIAGNNQQSALIKKHSGGSKNAQLNPKEIVIPQAPEHGMPKISPVDGNSNATAGAKTLTQSVANSEFDNMVGQNPPKTGGRKSRKKRSYRRRKTNKRQTPKKKSRKKRTKHRRNNKKRKSRRR